MNESLYMLLAFMAGLLLGALFFGGLWLTIKKIANVPIPALWISISAIFRVGIVLTGFYYIGFAHWQRLVICVVGFIIARYIVVYLTKPVKEVQLLLNKEDNHEA